MQDPTDNVTRDLPLERKRGRPATGNAKTSAQRKAEQRARDHDALVSGRIEDASTQALAEELASAVAGGFVYSAEELTAELLRRARAEQQARIDRMKNSD